MSLEVISAGEICELRLDAPPGNIIDRELCLALAEAIRTHGGDANLKAFLFTAKGKHFSYGASVPEHVRGEVERFLPAFREVFEALMDSSVCTIAAVRGLCLGGAFELVSFCNFLVAEKSATFSVPEISLGVFPPPAAAILPWRLGGAVAEDLILTGRKMSAEEGARRGLVTRLCEPGELDKTVENFLDTTIRPRSAAVLRLAVRAVRGPFFDEMRRRLPQLERGYLDDLMALEDANEGIAAFLEKRKPVWVNA